jgi:hypothetical protein
MSFSDLSGMVSAGIIGDANLTESAVITHGTTPRTVAGIFYNNYEAAKVMGLEYESAMPMLDILLADGIGLAQDDKVVVVGVTYYIEEIQRDNDGFVRLILKKNKVR